MTTGEALLSVQLATPSASITPSWRRAIARGRFRTTQAKRARQRRGERPSSIHRSTFGVRRGLGHRLPWRPQEKLRPLRRSFEAPPPPDRLRRTRRERSRPDRQQRTTDRNPKTKSGNHQGATNTTFQAGVERSGRRTRTRLESRRSSFPTSSRSCAKRTRGGTDRKTNRRPKRRRKCRSSDVAEPVLVRTSTAASADLAPFFDELGVCLRLVARTSALVRLRFVIGVTAGQLDTACELIDEFVRSQSTTGEPFR